MQLAQTLRQITTASTTREAAYSYNLDTMFRTQRTTNTGSTIGDLTETYDLLHDRLIKLGYPKKFVMVALTGGSHHENAGIISAAGITASTITAEVQKKKNSTVFVKGTMFVNLTIEQFSLLGALDLCRRNIVWSKLNGGHRSLRHFLDICATVEPNSVTERVSKTLSYTVFPDFSDTESHPVQVNRQNYFDADCMNKLHSLSSRVLSDEEMSNVLGAIAQLSSLERLYEQDIHHAKTIWFEHQVETSKTPKATEQGLPSATEAQTFTNLTWS